MDAEAVEAVEGRGGAGQGGCGYDEETLFDLHVILKMLKGLPQDRLVRKAREVGIRITPKDLQRGGAAAMARVVRNIRKPKVWARLRDWASWCHSGDIARVKAARSQAVLDELLDDGLDWATVYWLCLKAGRYHDGMIGRYGQAAAAAIEDARESSRSLLASVDCLREAVAARQDAWRRALQEENAALAKRLRAAEERIEQLKAELIQARRAARAEKEKARQAAVALEKAGREAAEEARRLRERAEAAEAALRKEAEEAERMIRATVQVYEQRLAVLRELLEQQDGEVLELLALTRRGEALSSHQGAAAALKGRTICVVGGDTRAAGYREIVEAYGARMVFASALEKLGQIEGAVSGSDGVVLIAAYATHKASGLVRQAAERYGRPVALAHNAGLATFERVLVSELAPRLGR